MDADEELIDIKKIRRLRLNRALSQADAAKAASISGRQQWCDIERGRNRNPKINTLARIARVLGVNLKDLLK